MVDVKHPGMIPAAVISAVLAAVPAALSAQATTTPWPPGECQAAGPPHAGDQVGLLSLARAMAAGGGDPSPTSIAYTTLSRQDAVTAVAPGDMLGQAADRERPVWPVVMHGSFTLGSAPRPPGASAPTGSVFAVAVDRTTGSVSDESLGTSEPVLPAGAPPLVPLTDDNPYGPGAPAAFPACPVWRVRALGLATRIQLERELAAQVHTPAARRRRLAVIARVTRSRAGYLRLLGAYHCP